VAPTFAQTLQRAWHLALFGALLVTLLYVAAALLHGLEVPALLAQAGRLGLAVFGVFFLVAVVFLQRAWQDRAFTTVGLLATFFGLGILLYFFTQLALDVHMYFEVAPALIEAHNQQLHDHVERAEQRLQEAPPGERQELRQRAAEARAAAIQGVRHATSAGALLWHFLTHGPSDQPQDVGIGTALLGSLWVAGITILFAVPVGIGAALYLEEYRGKGWLRSLIQLNISNLAGVPPVVFGILGGFIFVELLFKPLTRDYPGIAAGNVIGGGLTLGLLTLPVIIVAAQEAIRAVPLSLRQEAYALGATRWQVIRHQVLPLALPGILTGTILALSRALGEAAPLVLLGALRYVDQVPWPWTRFTVLPLQIFGWSDQPQPIWRANAALASVLLLAVLLVLNGVAIYLRYRAQRQPRA
jgi:phosphate transport system permease protein